MDFSFFTDRWAARIQNSRRRYAASFGFVSWVIAVVLFGNTNLFHVHKKGYVCLIVATLLWPYLIHTLRFLYRDVLVDHVSIPWRLLFLLFEVVMSSLFASASVDIPEQLKKGDGVGALVFSFISIYLAEIALLDDYNYELSSLFQGAFLSIIYEKVIKDVRKLFGYSLASYLPRFVFLVFEEFSPKFHKDHDLIDLEKGWLEVRQLLDHHGFAAQCKEKIEAHTIIVQRVSDRVRARSGTQRQR